MHLHRLFLFRWWVLLVIMLIISRSFEIEAGFPVRQQQEDSGDVPTLVARFGDGIIGTAVEWLSDTKLAVGGTVGVWLYNVSDMADEHPPAEYPRTLLDHEGGITDLASNANRSLLVSVGNGTIRLWDEVSKTFLAEVPGWDAVALSPDGTLLVSGDGAAGFNLWSLGPDEAPIPALIEHITFNEMAQVTGKLEFSADGAWLAASSFVSESCMSPGATSFVAWRVEELRAGNTEPLVLETVLNAGNPFILSPDSQTLVYSAYDLESGGGVRLIDLETRSMIGLDSGVIDGLFYHTPDELLYRKHNAGTIEWWRWLSPDFISGELESIDSYRNGIRDLQLSSNGQHLAIASGSTIEIINANTHITISTMTDSADVPGAETFGSEALMTSNASGSALIERLNQYDGAVLLSEDGSTRVRRTLGNEYYENGYETLYSFEDVSGTVRSTVTIRPIYEAARTALSHDGSLFAAMLDSQLGCGNEGGMLHVWDTVNGELRVELPAGVGEMTFNNDHSLLAFSEGERLRLINPSTGEEIANWRAAADSITNLAFDAESQMLIAQSADGTVSFWEL
jgi:WD40 repeat protein